MENNTTARGLRDRLQDMTYSALSYVDAYRSSYRMQKRLVNRRFALRMVAQEVGTDIYETLSWLLTCRVIGHTWVNKMHYVYCRRCSLGGQPMGGQIRSMYRFTWGKS